MSDGRPRVIVADCDHPSIEIEKEVLSQINPKFMLAHCKTEDEVIGITIDADGIISQYPPITRRVIESLQKCKVIARYGVGANNIDVEAATEHIIIVANVPDYCIDEVSTHAIALILSCARKIPLLDKKIGEKQWDFSVAKPLFRT